MATAALNYRVVEPKEPVADRVPLLLLHGLFGSNSNFSSVGRKCCETLGGRVLLPDLRNHGQSAWDSDCSFESMADDLIGVLDREGIASAVLCGHSLGGKAVMAASLLHPTRVEGMICVDIAPIDYGGESADWRGNQAIKAAMAAAPREALGSRKTAEEALKPVVPDAGVRQFLLQNLLPDEHRWCRVASHSRPRPVNPLLGTAAVPTMPALLLCPPYPHCCCARHARTAAVPATPALLLRLCLAS